MNHGRARLGLSGLFVLLALQSVAAEAPWRVERGDVRVLVPLKPGGAFTAGTSALTGALVLEPGKPARLTGEISMDLATIDTGIALRNKHLRETYLEVAKGAGFDKAVLSEIRLNEADGESFDGRTAFTGNLLLHGMKHAVDGTAEIRHDGQGRRVQAEFRIVLTDFGVKPPEYLGVGVGDRLLVKVDLTAAQSAK